MLRVAFEPSRWVGMNTIFIYLFAPSAELFGNIQRWLYFNGNEGAAWLFVCFNCLFNCSICSYDLACPLF